MKMLAQSLFFTKVTTSYACYAVFGIVCVNSCEVNSRRTVNEARARDRSGQEKPNFES